MSLGHVSLVGAGPGAADLITVRGRRLLESADAVVHDRLVGPGVLDLIPASAKRIDVGKTGYGAATPQAEIVKSLIELARSGLNVVRLKGGDPFVFGRGGEESEALSDAGIPFEIVPGVTAGVAGPALAGIPLTHRGLARSVGFVTATTSHPTTDEPISVWDPVVDSGPDRDALARLDTLVVYMAGKAAASVAQGLLDAGRLPSTPTALIIDASLPSAEVRTSDLATLAATGAGDTQGRPTLLVVGKTVALRERIGPDAPQVPATT